MSYTALYRKFRPDTFEDVKGQEHIVTTLKNQINADRIGHAYLFCGTRGTGKTTVAKILAKAVNCENLKDGSPCNECPVCRAITSGASMNVIEIDAASNNGVDNIREIREEVQYPPTEGRYKVYIIDEVHMLSIGAFNALLKTLEEPPSYVIFILATTEAHKIPVTILSRCQRYDFKRISIDVISDRIRELTEKENVDIEEKAVRYIAKAADGAMRDALSLLDRCIAFYLGEKLTYDKVLEILGAVDTSVFSNMLRYILNGNVTGAISSLDDIIMSGRDLSQFITDFTWYLRNILLIKSSDGEVSEIIDVSSDKMEELRQDGAMADENTLMRYIRILSELGNQLKFATSKRVLAEIAVVKMIKPVMETDLSSVINRIANIERKIESGSIIETLDVPAGENNKALPQNKEEASGRKQERKLDIAVPEDVQNVVNNWNRIENKIGGMAKAALKQGRFTCQGDNRLIIQFEDSTTYGMVSDSGITAQIENIIAEETGKSIKVEIKLSEGENKQEDSFVEVLNKNIKMEVVEEDF
ncbi:MAG: DNA polymerase III subunit gamma/tau [Lachnospiraceae bacterium]